jgi:hypothetical protein
VFPFFIQVLEIGVIKESLNRCGLIIEYSSSPMELVNKPLPFVGKFIIRIIEFTIAMHIVIFPLAIIEAAFLVEEPSFAVPHAITFIALISASIFILLNNIVALIVGPCGNRTLTNLRDGTKGLIRLISLLLTRSRSDQLRIVLLFCLFLIYNRIVVCIKILFIGYVLVLIVVIVTSTLRV